MRTPPNTLRTACWLPPAASTSSTAALELALLFPTRACSRSETAAWLLHGPMGRVHERVQCALVQSLVRSGDDGALPW